MGVRYGKFEMPDKIVIEEEDPARNYARFAAEPFERGFGHTLGNTLRRLMLSSLEAPAIISVMLEGVPHEYMAVQGIVEDMTNIVLNFKGALLRKLPKDDAKGSRQNRIITMLLDITQEDLEKNGGQVQIKLGDLVNDGYFEVVNPKHHLFTVTKPMKRQVNLKIGFGRGYVPSERHEIYDKLMDEIVVDSAFSPVRLVNYFVENTRVGQDTDFDKLVLDVYTDGRISPREALTFASQIAVKHFAVFEQLQTEALNFDDQDLESDATEDEFLDKLSLRIDEIELSVRSTNCLSGANIESIAELVIIPERKMLEFRNFGKKSLNEIKAKLTEMSLSLGMDLSKYGLTPENVKGKIRDYQEQKRQASELSQTP